MKQKDEGMGWVNSIHTSVSESVYQSAKWFDEFFMEDGSDISNPKAQARILIGWRPHSRDFSELETKFRLKVRLPNLKNKVDLILSDDDEYEQSTLPLESSRSTSKNTDDHFTAAIRIINKDVKNSQLESRIGISGGDIFSRIKYVKKFTWFERHAFIFNPSVYYYLNEGLGGNMLLEYNYQLKAAEQLRVDYSMRGSESFSGMRWRNGFYKLSQINENTASILGLQIEGEQRAKTGFTIEKYTLSYRYRFNAVKEWIFFEVEPFLEWSLDENYTTTPGIALRIEGYFQKNKTQLSLN